ncbi:hypothetical protein [Asaia sp. HN010]|uniref:hypothetical protein n=1 Tax=Asaia sp. HN010 TaxID=3081233 RepID=UPI003017C7AD
MAEHTVPVSRMMEAKRASDALFSEVLSRQGERDYTPASVIARVCELRGILTTIAAEAAQ